MLRLQDGDRLQRFSPYLLPSITFKIKLGYYPPCIASQLQFKTSLWTSIRLSLSLSVSARNTLEAVLLILVLVHEFLARFRWMGRCHNNQPKNEIIIIIKRKLDGASRHYPECKGFSGKKITRRMLSTVCYSVFVQSERALCTVMWGGGESALRG